MAALLALSLSSCSRNRSATQGLNAPSERDVASVGVASAGAAPTGEAEPLALGSANPATSLPAVTAASLPALTGAWLETLSDAPGSPVVTLPLGARTARPILVAAHGAGDRPEWACGGWRLASSSYAFVVCPRGTPTAGNRYAWSSASSLASSVRSAVAAVRARYGAHVAQEPPLYAGFSQGATLAPALLLEHAGEFPNAIFAEGGYASLEDASFARRYRANGGQRLLIVCGTPGCFTRTRAAERVLQREGLRVAITGDAAAGHNLNERMQKALQSAWPALVREQPGWHSFD